MEWWMLLLAVFTHLGVAIFAFREGMGRGYSDGMEMVLEEWKKHLEETKEM